MVQEFKDYDKVYSKFKHKLMQYEIDSRTFDITKADKLTGWSFKIAKYSNEEIREAVYFEKTAEEWQKFRVSLKGFNTWEKLYRLEYRLQHFAGTSQYMLEVLRVDNYLGALVRGGQLSTTHVIQH